MNSAFRGIWLVPQSRDIKYYSPPGGFRVKKMSRETHFIRKWSNFLGIAIKLVLYILKQLFASVSVTSGGYLPRQSGSVNIHRYSPPLRRIIVNYGLNLWWDGLWVFQGTGESIEQRLPQLADSHLAAIVVKHLVPEVLWLTWRLHPLVNYLEGMVSQYHYLFALFLAVRSSAIILFSSSFLWYSISSSSWGR